MSAEDALLYIDANKYLDLYRTDKGKKILGPLAEQIEHIFVTQQTVTEVQRNKIFVAATFLAEKCKALHLQTFNVPDHLSGTSEGQGKQILKDMSAIVLQIKNVNKEVEVLATGILEQVSRSEDEVSVSLEPIFAKAIPHSVDELGRARERRELGNPPGKIANAIGDQLTWEQILSHFKGKKRLWIITRDGDYGTFYGGKGFVNRQLVDELCAVTPDAEAFLFADMVEGIEHFVKTTGAKAEKRLTREEAAEIELEEQSLPPFPNASVVLYPSIIEIERAAQPSICAQQSIAEVMRAIQPTIDFQKSLAEIARAAQPSISAQQSIAEVMRAIQPYIDFQKSLAEIARVAQPNISAQQSIAEAMKAFQPTNDFQKLLAEIERAQPGM